jgi:uncharacterized membrane protein
MKKVALLSAACSRSAELFKNYADSSSFLIITAAASCLWPSQAAVAVVAPVLVIVVAVLVQVQVQDLAQAMREGGHQPLAIPVGAAAAIIRLVARMCIENRQQCPQYTIECSGNASGGNRSTN